MHELYIRESKHFLIILDFKSIERHERMARDELLGGAARGQRKHKGNRHNESATDQDEPDGLRPGDKGWIHRARVPQPSVTSYVNRPEWTSDVDISRSNRHEPSRLDKYMRKDVERKRNAKQRRAVDISIEGRKMAL